MKLDGRPGDGLGISSVTIQKILNEHGMGTRYDRWLKLESRHSQEAIELTAEQVQFLEQGPAKLGTPSFRERHVESSRPGELLCQDTFTVGRIKGVGRIIY